MSDLLCSARGCPSALPLGTGTPIVDAGWTTVGGLWVCPEHDQHVDLRKMTLTMSTSDTAAAAARIIAKHWPDLIRTCDDDERGTLQLFLYDCLPEGDLL